MPHLSNETYELEITVLNVQSYPVVTGNWTVRFNTTGKANLTITAIEYTSWSNYSEDAMLYDLKFLELRCGNDTLNYSWVGEGCSVSGSCSVFIEDYECNYDCYETSKVITPGKHDLEFDFGGIKAYAKFFKASKHRENRYKCIKYDS